MRRLRIGVLAAIVAMAAPLAGPGSPVSADAVHRDSFAFRLFGGDDDPGRLASVDLARYRLFLLSPYMTRIAARVKEVRSDALVYGYKDASSTRRDLGDPADRWCNADGGTIGRDWGVDYCDTAANHPDWFLTVNGDRFEYTGYRSHWHTDVGAAGYQERWSQNVLAELRRSSSFDGVFVDNQLTKINAYTPGGALPDQYRSNEAGQAAYQGFIDYAGRQLRGAGYGIVANMADARLFPGLWDAYSAQQSGGFDEFWTTFGGTDDAPDNLPAYEPSGWQSQIAEAESYHGTAKLGVFSAQTAGGRCNACALYGYASFLLADDGRQLFMESDVDAVVGDWVSARAMYDWDLGAPTGPREQVETNLHRRTFERGLALVNADARTERRVDLPATYLDESGNPVDSVVVGARRGRILRGPAA